MGNILTERKFKGIAMKEKFKKFRKTRLYSFLTILVAITVCILIGMGIAFYQHANNPTDEGSKYLRAFIMQDYDTMYKMVDKDTTKISKEKFIEKMKSLRQTYEIDSYDIGKVEEKDGTKYITMTCTDDQTKKKKDFTVYFAKDGFFNPTYTVDLSKVNEDEEMMANEYQNTLSTSADGVMNRYYTAVRNEDKKCNDVISLFKNKNAVKKKIRKTVGNNIKVLTKGSKKKKVKKYVIKDIKIDSIKKAFKYNSQRKQFTVVYSYNYNYISATNISLSNSYVFKKKGKRKVVMTLTYDYDGNNVSLVGFNMIDKKK
ncbi:MAG: hypothetical protein K6E58_01900 [Eubacterium sp.]|nr:hypothetical protein [Eubacterium sp.]